MASQAQAPVVAQPQPELSSATISSTSGDPAREQQTIAQLSADSPYPLSLVSNRLHNLIHGTFQYKPGEAVSPALAASHLANLADVYGLHYPPGTVCIPIEGFSTSAENPHEIMQVYLVKPPNGPVEIIGEFVQTAADGTPTTMVQRNSIVEMGSGFGVENDTETIRSRLHTDTGLPEVVNHVEFHPKEISEGISSRGTIRLPQP